MKYILLSLSLLVFVTSLQGQDFRIVETGLETGQTDYSGSCPVTIWFKGWITTSGPGPVAYRFDRSDSASNPVMNEQVILKTNRVDVSYDWTVGGPGDQFEGWVALHSLEPSENVSSKAMFRIRCAGGTINEEDQKRRLDEKLKEPPAPYYGQAEEAKQKPIEESTAGEEFIPCPLDTVTTQMTTSLPEPWFITPQVGKLVDTGTEIIGGKPTLICNYWAYGRTVAVMREFPSGVKCRAADRGFYCSQGGSW